MLVLYNHPADPAAFDSYYYNTHIPLAERIPGLRSYSVSTAPPRVLAGNGFHLIAELTFDSMDDLNGALASPEGQATAADLANFAQAGATLLIYDTREVDVRGV